MDYKVGKIEDITTQNINGKVKRTVKLRIENEQFAFFEFQGRNVNLLQGFKKNDDVKLSFVFKGLTSRLGVHYNNLIGKNINKL